MHFHEIVAPSSDGITVSYSARTLNYDSISSLGTLEMFSCPKNSLYDGLKSRSRPSWTDRGLGLDFVDWAWTGWTGPGLELDWPWNDTGIIPIPARKYFSTILDVFSHKRPWIFNGCSTMIVLVVFNRGLINSMVAKLSTSMLRPPMRTWWVRAFIHPS